MDGAWTLLEPIPVAQTEAPVIQPEIETPESLPAECKAPEAALIEIQSVPEQLSEEPAAAPPVALVEGVGVGGITAHSFAQRPSPSQRYALGPSLSRDAGEGVLSARQFPHAAVDAIERQREHALFHQLADHADAGGAAPIFLRHRVEPHRPWIGVEQTAEPGFARF